MNHTMTTAAGAASTSPHSRSPLVWLLWTVLVRVPRRSRNLATGRMLLMSVT
jgi:hypothetical protein